MKSGDTIQVLSMGGKINMVPTDVDVPTVEEIIFNLVFCDLIRGFDAKRRMNHRRDLRSAAKRLT